MFHKVPDQPFFSIRMVVLSRAEQRDGGLVGVCGCTFCIKTSRSETVESELCSHTAELPWTMDTVESKPCSPIGQLKWGVLHALLLLKWKWYVKMVKNAYNQNYLILTTVTVKYIWNLFKSSFIFKYNRRFYRHM